MPDQPTPDAETLSIQDRNKAVVRQYFERCWNQGDLDFAQTIMVPDYDLHFDDGPGGYAAWRAGVEWFRQAFSPIHFDLEDLIAEGDIVAVRSVWTAKHIGEFMGVQPTGKTFTARNADFYRLRDGKMIAHWDVNDFLSILCQIGGPAGVGIALHRCCSGGRGRRMPRPQSRNTKSAHPGECRDPDEKTRTDRSLPNNVKHFCQRRSMIWVPAFAGMSGDFSDIDSNEIVKL